MLFLSRILPSHLKPNKLSSKAYRDSKKNQNFQVDFILSMANPQGWQTIWTLCAVASCTQFNEWVFLLFLIGNGVSRQLLIPKTLQSSRCFAFLYCWVPVVLWVLCTHNFFLSFWPSVSGSQWRISFRSLNKVYFFFLTLNHQLRYTQK